MEEELRLRLDALERRLAAAQGEATFAGLMIGMLIPGLIKGRVVDKEKMVAVIDAAGLILERHRAPLSTLDQSTLDHARGRLSALLAACSAVQT